MNIINPLINPIQNNGDSLTPEQLEQVKVRAKQSVDNYVNTTSSAGIRTIRQSMDERKYQHALLHKAGLYTHDMLKREAAVREITEDALADMILAKAEYAEKIEVWRINVKVLIDRSKSRSGIVGILTEAGVPIDPQQFPIG